MVSARRPRSSWAQGPAMRRACSERPMAARAGAKSCAIPTPPVFLIASISTANAACCWAIRLTAASASSVPAMPGALGSRASGQGLSMAKPRSLPAEPACSWRVGAPWSPPVVRVPACITCRNASRPKAIGRRSTRHFRSRRHRQACSRWPAATRPSWPSVAISASRPRPRSSLPCARQRPLPDATRSASNPGRSSWGRPLAIAPVLPASSARTRFASRPAPMQTMY